MVPKPSFRAGQLTDLQQIMNVGPAIADELRRIGIQHPRDLQGQDPYNLYDQLCELDGKRHDPCVLDVFISAVEFVNHGVAKPWWEYTAQRKSELAKRQQNTTHKKRTAKNEDSRRRNRKLGRRAFLFNGALILAAADAHHAAPKTMPDQQQSRPQLTFGLMTDLHYADKPPGGTRHYRQTPAKLAAAVKMFAKRKPDFVVELGDFVDAADSVDIEKAYLRTIHQQFDALPGNNHYVLGNHCVYTLTKQEFLNVVGQPASFYSFDTNGVHFVVLDACFRHDGVPYGRKNFDWTDPNVPRHQLNWLRHDLQTTEHPTIAFIHQRLDVDDHYGVKNAADVRKILEQSKKVTAVFQGHNHKNDYQEIGGIHYCTLTAMVDGSGKQDNAFATVAVFPDTTLHLTGYFKQRSYDFD
jgi:alkaline phosphatase